MPEEGCPKGTVHLAVFIHLPAAEKCCEDFSLEHSPFVRGDLVPMMNFTLTHVDRGLRVPHNEVCIMAGSDETLLSFQPCKSCRLMGHPFRKLGEIMPAAARLRPHNRKTELE